MCGACLFYRKILFPVHISNAYYFHILVHSSYISVSEGLSTNEWLFHVVLSAGVAISLINQRLGTDLVTPYCHFHLVGN